MVNAAVERIRTGKGVSRMAYVTEKAERGLGRWTVAVVLAVVLSWLSVSGVALLR